MGQLEKVDRYNCNPGENAIMGEAFREMVTHLHAMRAFQIVRGEACKGRQKMMRHLRVSFGVFKNKFLLFNLN
jgi:hypothetical protein